MPRVRWCDRPYEKTETSVLWLDRATWRLRGRVDLSSPGTHTKIFSLLALEPGR